MKKIILVFSILLGSFCQLSFGEKADDTQNNVTIDNNSEGTLWVYSKDNKNSTTTTVTEEDFDNLRPIEPGQSLEIDFNSWITMLIHDSRYLQNQTIIAANQYATGTISANTLITVNPIDTETSIGSRIVMGNLLF